MTFKEIPNGTFAAWVKFIVAVMLLPFLGWGVTFIVDTKVRIAQIEANRFTSADALKIYAELAKKADIVNVPPKHVEDRLSRLEESDLRLESLMLELIKRGKGE